MAEILVTFGVPAEGFYHKLKGHEIHIPPPGEVFERAALFELLPRMDVAVACTAFTREMIAAAARLRLIVCYGAGYDAIDVAAATERGVMVCNAPDPVAAPTAELAIAHILCLARRMSFFDHAMHETPPVSLFVMGKNMGASLEGATLGIVGMGRIGARVADFGHAMGMRVCYTSRTPKPERTAKGEEYLPLQELMSRSDFISIHCPHTPETTGLVSGEMLARMKPTAFIINTARGAIVDEEALLHALKTHAIAGAGLDVYQNEPDIDPAFLELDNVSLTPHVGANTAYVRRRLAEQVSDRILSVLKGGRPDNLLNMLP